MVKKCFHIVTLWLSKYLIQCNMSLVSDMYHSLDSTHTYSYEMVYMESVEGKKKRFSLLLPCMNS